MGFLSDTIDKVTGAEGASDASKEASKIASQGYLDAGDQYSEGIIQGGQTAVDAYSAERDFLLAQTQREREGQNAAQTQLMRAYGIGPDGRQGQQAFMDGLQDNPLAQAIRGTRSAGEDAISRNASMTGGLRSGNINANMYDFNQRLDERALLETYNQQIGGLNDIAGWNAQDQLVGNAISQPGVTQGNYETMASNAQGDAILGSTGALAQGKIGAAQAVADSRGQLIDAGATVAGGIWSDRRLKENVKLVEVGEEFNLYEWTWNHLANALGLHGTDVGVMADEVQETHPRVVGERQGYKTVNYDMLGI